MILAWTLIAAALAQTPAADALPELTPPVLILRPAMPWPEDTEGPPVQVKLLLLIDETGRVTSVTPISGSEPYLGLAAAAAAGLVFSPAREQGEPVASEVPFSWTLSEPAPPVDLRGQVLTRSGVPLGGISVQVGDQQISTDADGRFEVAGLAAGPAEIQIIDPGLSAEPLTVTINGESIAEVTLYAVPVRNDEAVAIYRKDAPPPEVRRIARLQLAEEPGAMGDPVRALQNQPGLVRAPLDAGWLLLRGGGPEDTRVFVDGVGVPLLFHLGGLTSILHPEMVESVQLSPSFPDADRGGTLAGSAEIETRRAESTSATAGLNLAYAHAYAQTGSEDAGISLAARRSYLDAVLALALPEEAAGIAPRFWDVAARGHLGRTDAMALAIFDSAITPGENDEAVELAQSAAQLQVRTVADLRATTLTAQGWLATERRRLSTNIRDEHLLTAAPGARIQAHTLRGPLTFGGGLVAELREYQLIRNDGYRRARIGTVDPFSTAVLDLQAVTLEGHLRLETLFVEDQRARLGLSPRLRARWRPLDELSLTAEVGRSLQPPDTLAMVAFPEGTYLDLHSSWTAALTGAWTRDASELRAAVYSRRIDQTGYELDGTLGPLEGRADGLELSGSTSTKRFDVRAIAQLSRSQLREDPDESWLPQLYEQPLRLHLQGQWRLPKAWNLGARTRYSSGFYNLRGLTEAFDILTQTDMPIEQGRLPAYAALDLRVSKTWTGRTTELTAYIDLLNATGRRIPEPAINGIDDAVVLYTFGLPILPLFGVEGRWDRPSDQESRQAREPATSAR